MPRWLLLGTCLALAACGATPATMQTAPPLSAEQVPDALHDRSSDAPPAGPFLRGLRLPGPRRGWTPSDERPPWLPTVPGNLERHPVPEHWYRDNIAALRLPYGH